MGIINALSELDILAEEIVDTTMLRFFARKLFEVKLLYPEVDDKYLLLNSSNAIYIDDSDSSKLQMMNIVHFLMQHDLVRWTIFAIKAPSQESPHIYALFAFPIGTPDGVICAINEFWVYHAKAFAAAAIREAEREIVTKNKAAAVVVE